MSAGMGIAITVALLAVNAFFVAGEFAVTSTRRSQVEPLADEGVRGALRIMRNIARDKDLRERVTTMARTFKKYDRHLCGVAIVARKPKENS